MAGDNQYGATGKLPTTIRITNPLVKADDSWMYAVRFGFYLESPRPDPQKLVLKALARPIAGIILRRST